LTRDLNSYDEIGVTADGATVAAVQMETQSGIEIGEVRDGVLGAFIELIPTSALRPGDSGVAWLDEHRLAHSMLQGTVRQVFITDTGTKASRALTSGPAHQNPSLSRDGHTMAVVRADGDQVHIYRVDPETGREQRLTEGQFDAP